MTGDHPAQVAGFADPAEIGFGDLVAAMLDAGRRAPGVNGARHISEPFAQAWSDVAGAQVAVRRDLHAFELRGRAAAGRAAGRVPDGERR